MGCKEGCGLEHENREGGKNAEKPEKLAAAGEAWEISELW